MRQRPHGVLLMKLLGGVGMEASSDKHYENLTIHLRYLNDKIIEAFSLFIKLATTIIGGVFFLHLKLPQADSQRASMRYATNGLIILVGLSMILLIWDNLFSWLRYRKALNDNFPFTKPKSSSKKTLVDKRDRDVCVNCGHMLTLLIFQSSLTRSYKIFSIK